MMNPVIRYILTDLFNITGFSMNKFHDSRLTIRNIYL